MYELVFTILVAIVVTVSIQWVGILVISSMIILPPAAARNISLNMKQYHVYSLLIALISGISGLILSYIYGCATGATIVLISAVFFLFTYIVSYRRIR